MYLKIVCRLVLQIIKYKDANIWYYGSVTTFDEGIDEITVISLFYISSL